jgi:hypothetical protein
MIEKEIKEVSSPYPTEQYVHLGQSMRKNSKFEKNLGQHCNINQ